jgi:hypothetical protein
MAISEDLTVWTDDTSFAVSPSTAEGQSQTKNDSTSLPHSFRVQNNDAYSSCTDRPLVDRNIIDRPKSVNREVFVAWETLSYDMS